MDKHLSDRRDIFAQHTAFSLPKRPAILFTERADGAFAWPASTVERQPQG